MMTGLKDEISYGMFSTEGNLAVHGIIVAAVTSNLTWAQTYRCLRVLSDSDYGKFGEAMDTEVREAVYSACGFTTDFYGA